MKYYAGIDIGNSTTETAIARISDGSIQVIAEGIVDTTGIKGTLQNIHGIFGSLNLALKNIGIAVSDLDSIILNEAAPVIGDVAMETITETIITESTMIGHNPETPGGLGLGVGYTVAIENLNAVDRSQSWIVVVSKNHDYEDVARQINLAFDNHIDIQAVILQKDDGVLVNNRLKKVIPIVDEVCLIEKVPMGVKGAVEVAPAGRVISQLSNPYGIATAFELTSEETKRIVPLARAIIGTRSAVVLKTLAGDIKERIIPAGSIHFIGETKTREINVDAGAELIMETQAFCEPIKNIKGESGTHAGGMLEKIRQVMSELTNTPSSEIFIKDLLATDTFIPQSIQGGLAGEFAMENAVGIAAMVQADRLQMMTLANELSTQLKISVKVGGVEADMAIRGALTTPGTSKPLAIIDMGAGSTDASIMNSSNGSQSVHLAGAGNMVTMIINTELGLDNHHLAEELKIYPLAKVESLFHIRHEDGSVQFFDKALAPELFARVVTLQNETMNVVPTKHTLEEIKKIRQDAKQKVFVVNAIRALKQLAPAGDIRSIDHVVLVGGSALDFEIPQLVTHALSQYGIVAGSGNIRGKMGPRNAVATGLALSFRENLI